MKPSNLYLPGLDTSADYGRWDPNDFAPCETPTSAFESALKTPADGDVFHAPIWAPLVERQKTQQRLDKSSRHMGSAAPSAHEPFAVLGNREPYFRGLKSPAAYQQFIQNDPSRVGEAGRSPAPARDSEINPRGRSSGEDVPRVPPLPVGARRSHLVKDRSRKTQSKIPVLSSLTATRLREPKQPAVKLTATHAAAKPSARSSTLSFAAIYDPDSGRMTTVSGSALLRNSSLRRSKLPQGPASAPATLQKSPVSRPAFSRAADTAPLAPKKYSSPASGQPQHAKGRSLPSSPKAFLRPKPPMRSASDGDQRIAEISYFAPLKTPVAFTTPVGFGSRDAFVDLSDDSLKAAHRNFSLLDEDFLQASSLFSSPEALNTRELPGHDDCEPDLTSRFSTSTTSTSEYIDIDFPPEDSARQFARSALDRHSKSKKKTSVLGGGGGLGVTFNSPSSPDLAHRGTKSPPPSAFPGRGTTPSPTPTEKPRVSRRPSFLGKLKRSSKDQKGWISVEVMTILEE